MTFLLDTHAFLWFALSDSRLSQTGKELISTPSNRLFLSPASYWEIAIKVSLGRYELSDDFGLFMREQIAENSLDILPITLEHAAIVARLPFHHRDPFDRMLVAQAIGEKTPILSCDTTLDAYEIARVW